MIRECGSVEYEVRSISSCENPNCSSRYSYGTRVYVREQKTLYNLIPIKGTLSYKEYCPEHTEDKVYAQEARNMQHNKAINKWKRRKEKRLKKEYDKILSSDLFPIFRFSKNKVRGPRERRLKMKLEENSFKHAIEKLCNFELPCSVLLKNSNELEYAIISNSGLVEHKSHNKGDKVDFELFNDRYDKQEFKDRQFYAVQTNSLTGMLCDEEVHKFEQFVEEIIEWREYNSYQDSLRFSACPHSNHSITNVEFSRAVIDGREEIIVICNSYGCGKVVGTLNRRYASNEAYDLNT